MRHTDVLATRLSVDIRTFAPGHATGTYLLTYVYYQRYKAFEYQRVTSLLFTACDPNAHSPER